MSLSPAQQELYAARVTTVATSVQSALAPDRAGPQTLADFEAAVIAIAERSKLEVGALREGDLVRLSAEQRTEYANSVRKLAEGLTRAA